MSETPLVTPFATAHATAVLYSEFAETSVNLPVLSYAGESAFFHKYMTVDAIVQGVSPSKLPPETIPF